MNKLYLALDSMTKVNELRIKAKRQKERELMEAAKKTFWAGGIQGIDLGLIAYKNNQKAF